MLVLKLQFFVLSCIVVLIVQDWFLVYYFKHRAPQADAATGALSVV